MGNAGTFVGAKLTEDCADRLIEWMTQQGIPNPTPKEELHCTVVYSEEREIKITPLAYEPPLEIDPRLFKFKHFGENREVLVLAFDRPELAYRHKLLREKYKLGWKFPSYIPHVTLSYNAPEHIEVLPDFPLVFQGEEVGGFNPPEESAAAEHLEKNELSEYYEIVNDEPVRKKKRPEPPKKLIAQNLIKLGLKEDRHHEDHPRVQEPGPQQLSYTSSMRQNAVGQKCQVIVQMPVQDFLRLTTTNDADIETVFRKQAHPLDSYNHWNRMGDEREYASQVNQGKTSQDKDYQWGRIVGPFLRIDIEPPAGTFGKVSGHEGRHRAAAVWNAGGKVIPVALCLRPFKGMFPKSYGPEYEAHREHIPMAVHGQFRSISVSTRNWKVIEPDLLKPYRRTNESVLMEVAGSFSWFHPKTEQEVTAEFGKNEHWDLVKANPTRFGMTRAEVNQPNARIDDVFKHGWVRVNYYRGVWYFHGQTAALVQAAAKHYAWAHEGLHEVILDIVEPNYKSYTLMGPAIEKFLKHGVLPEWR